MRRACALIALNTGYTEDEIDEMTYMFYKDLLIEISINLQFKTVVNLLGRDYADETTFDMVHKANPLFVNLDEASQQKVKKVTMNTLRSFGLLK
jgi:hypothetical protein